MSPRITAALTTLTKTAGVNFRAAPRAIGALSRPLETPLAARMATQAASTPGVLSLGGAAPRPRPNLTWANPAAAPPAMPQSGGAATPGFDIGALLKSLGIGAGNVATSPLRYAANNPRKVLGTAAVGGGLYGLKQLGDGLQQRAESGFLNANNQR